MPRLVLCLFIVTFSLRGVLAQVPNPIDCSRASTTVELNYCAERDFEKADAALNAAYQMALAHIAKSDNPEPYDTESWEGELRKAQRAWIAFRDAECKGLVPMEWSGGTGAAAAVLGCMERLTKARTQTLRQRYKAR